MDLSVGQNPEMLLLEMSGAVVTEDSQIREKRALEVDCPRDRLELFWISGEELQHCIQIADLIFRQQIQYNAKVL